VELLLVLAFGLVQERLQSLRRGDGTVVVVVIVAVVVVGSTRAGCTGTAAAVTGTNTGTDTAVGSNGRRFAVPNVVGGLRARGIVGILKKGAEEYIYRRFDVRGCDPRQAPQDGFGEYREAGQDVCRCCCCCCSVGQGACRVGLVRRVQQGVLSELIVVGLGTCGELL
jgi:hypothetical protein